VSVPAHERPAAIAGAGVGWIAQIICSDELASGQLVSFDLGGWFPPGDEHHVLFPSNRCLSSSLIQDDGYFFTALRRQGLIADELVL
jgi:DNA-binding transcriptional LysR family regulator